MRSLFTTVILSIFLFVSCSKDNTMPSTMEMGGTDPADLGQLLYRGNFVDGPYGATTGVVQIYKLGTAYSLVLDSFTVSSGPDLHVYLSKEVQPLLFIDLGKLKANTGRQVYSIPGQPDFKTFQYALIHCQQFNHLFGSATLR